MALFAGDFHTIRRVFVYGFLWIVSVVLLGLTAARISFTRSHTFNASWETYVALLLADAVITMIWVPIGWIMLFHERFSGRYGVHHELIGAGVLWLLWLVGSAGFTNTVLPGTNYCPVGNQCGILGAILAFGWMGWSLLTILLILSLMGQAAAGATPVPAEKRGAAVV
ncbi:hypothetical protein B0H19DRAFT_1077540 [Mycena capillaripes]|nr:hypothetical protein B0H19DRAFT_1077540 [Mycena capillaripes]